MTVTPDALASLAVRIARAGKDCARSTALRGATRPMPPLPDLAAASSWPEAWHGQADALAGRLAAAAGATSQEQPQRHSRPGHPRPERPGPVADAVAYAGVDAVRYGLARVLTDPAGEIGLDHFVRADLADPYYAVCFACADSASTLRWAADLGLSREEPDERLAGLLGGPAETALLGQLSWLAERVAGAARRPAGGAAEVPGGDGAGLAGLPGELSGAAVRGTGGAGQRGGDQRPVVAGGGDADSAGDGPGADRGDAARPALARLPG